MSVWAVRLPASDSELALRLWRVEGVDVCLDGNHLWLRGGDSDEDVERVLRGFPRSDRFVVQDDRQLRPAQARVPSGWLPSGPWVPLRSWFEPRLPRASLPGEWPDAVALRLVPDETPREAAALLTSVECWRNYAVDAPQIRLDRWRFAATSDGQTLVHGTPLPPLPGQRLWDDQGVLVPIGWHWRPQVEAAVVRSVLEVSSETLVVWYANQTWETIQPNHLVGATRLAVRATAVRCGNVG